MTAISEGMSLEDFDSLHGRRRRIKGLRAGRGAKKALRKGFFLRQEPSKAEYSRIGPADSVTAPAQMVKVVGFNRVSISRDPDIVQVRGKVTEIQPEVEEHEAETLPEGAAFRAETEEVDVPGLPSEAPPLPQIPAQTVPPGRRKLAREEMETEAEAGPELEGAVGGHRVPEMADFDDMDDWQKAVSETVREDTRAMDIIEKSGVRQAAEAKRAKSAMVRQAAEFEQRFGADLARRFGAHRAPEGLPLSDLDQFDITAIIKGATELYAAKKAKKAEKKARKREAAEEAAAAKAARAPAFVAPVFTEGMSTTTLILVVGGGVAVLGAVLFFALRK